MTRVKISLAIFTLLIAASTLAGIFTSRKCDMLINDISDISAAYTSGSKDEAIENAKKLESDWNSFRKIAAALIKNCRFTEIDRLCSRAEHLAKKESPDLEAELSELEDMIKILKKGETPNISSIF